MATKQQAQIRNHNKMRLMGSFLLKEEGLLESELDIYRQIRKLQKELLYEWDDNSEVFLGHKLKPYKCSWCGRRSNVQYLYGEEENPDNFCKKHFDHMIENQ